MALGKMALGEPIKFEMSQLLPKMRLFWGKMSQLKGPVSQLSGTGLAIKPGFWGGKKCLKKRCRDAGKACGSLQIIHQNPSPWPVSGWLTKNR